MKPDHAGWCCQCWRPLGTPRPSGTTTPGELAGSRRWASGSTFVRSTKTIPTDPPKGWVFDPLQVACTLHQRSLFSYSRTTVPYPIQPCFFFFSEPKCLPRPIRSRFGKYIRLQYDKSRHLVGAWTDHFLLEKSRLVHVDEDERNYHIFYDLLRGLDPETRKQLRLADSAEDYDILAQAGCLE
jgi:hypothetical protein